MGRMKVQLKKIENKTYRHITFAKRKSGLVKKAHELSILCDVEIALIIFSPAGKLILFDAKKRMEEILEHYLDLPIQQRGRLHNEELIQRMVAQMNLEASIHKHLKSSGNIIHREPILEVIQSQILSCTSELEDIERQIMSYEGNPSCIKTMGEAEYQEKELEKTLKCIRIHRQSLEANNRCIQLASELAFQQEIVNAGGDMMRSSSHISNNPSHIDPAISATDFAGYNDGFQTLSSQHTLAQILQSPPLGMVHGYNFPSNNMPQSQFAQFGNINFTTGMNFNEEGSASTNAVQCYVGDPTMSCYGTCSHNDYCGCRPPFPFR